MQISRLYKKSQSSIELVIIVSAVLFAFIIFLGVLQQTSGNKNREKTDTEFQELAISVQNEINIAAKATDGYQRTFSIPEKMKGLDYTIQIVAGSIYLNSTEGKYATSFSVPDVTGQLQKEDNFIRKTNGEVLLN